MEVLLRDGGTRGTECGSSTATVVWVLSSSSLAGPSVLATFLMRESSMSCQGAGPCTCSLLVAWLNAVPECYLQFCKWSGQCLARFLHDLQVVQLWLVTQLQCSHPRCLVHVVLCFSNSAT